MPRRSRRRASGVLIATALLAAGAFGIAQPGASAAPGGGPVPADEGPVSFLGGAAPLTAADDGAAGDIARRFVDRYGARFGVDGAGNELVDAGSTGMADGGTAVRFQQEIDGVPVLAGQLLVRVDAKGRVRSSAGETTPNAPVDTTPSVDPESASGLAARLTARDDRVAEELLDVSVPELWIYDPVLVGAPDSGGPRLTWRMEVATPLGDVDRMVLLDAHTGAVALTYSQVHEVDSQVCDNANVVRTTTATTVCPSASQTVVRSDSTGTSAVADVENAYLFSKAVLSFYAALGRNSIDGSGMVVRSTVRLCTSSCPYQNAYWSGSQMVYGTGYASADDVVGHELTHGVTQYESDLLYYAESGAINESLSDVFGELFDQWYDGAADDDSPAAKWLMGEDLPIGAIRDMADPGAYGDPDRMTSADYVGSAADNHGVHSNSGVNNKAAFLITDGGVFNGQTITGLGISKAAAIYYEAQISLLTVGSDYHDLAVALPQACNNLIGQHGIVSGDCAEVTKAVTATEMALAPVVAGARLTAEQCPAGKVLGTILYSNDMEDGAGWTRTPSSGSTAFTFSSAVASQSGTRSLYAPDPGSTSAATATMTAAVNVPVGVQTYLRFDHWFSFDTTSTTYWDGGFVSYSATGPSGSYADLSTLSGVAAVNGYNGVLAATALGNDNPRQGQAAFVADSPGFQTSRYTLSALAGQSVTVRFLLGTDSSYGATGWAIDDVQIYTCVEPAATTTTAPATTTTAPAATTTSAPPAPTTTAPATTTTSAPATTTTSAPPAPTTTSTTVPPATPEFAAVSPSRVFDTRLGESPDAMVAVPKRAVTPDAPLEVQLAGLPGAVTPPTGLGAVSLNVAVTNPRRSGFVTLYPCGERKLVASVNFGAGQTVSNAVLAPVSAAGHLCFYASSPTDLVVDINGWFASDAAFTAVGPERVLDTRPGESPGALRSVSKAQASPTNVLRVRMAGLPGDATPASGLGAVSLNVAVTGSAAAGFVTVYPCGQRPLAASVNFAAGQTVSNAVLAPVSTGGEVCLYASSPTDVIVDITGWYPVGTSFNAVGPARVLDTRPGESPDAIRSVTKQRVGPDTPLRVQMASLGVTPASGLGAVSLNVAVTNPASAGFLTVYPCGVRELVASVNFGAEQTVSNAVLAPLSSAGDVCIYASSPTDVVVDINGWFPG